MQQIRPGMYIRMSPEYFYSKVEIPINQNECWIWKGYKDRGGYGRIGVNHKRFIGVHRYSYEINIGLIPDGLCVCHTCDNKLCVNPKHLWLGTSQENTADKINKNRQSRIFGEKNHFSKLKEAEVKKIKELISNGKDNREIAKLFNVTHSNISAIRVGKSWKDVR